MNRVSISCLAFALSFATANAQCPYREQELEVDGSVDGDAFGTSMDNSATLLVVGAPGSRIFPDGYRGAVHVYERIGERWEETALLEAVDGRDEHHFGDAVAVAGDWVAVGAPADDDLGGDAGAVYLFHHDANGWSQVQKLFAPDAAPESQFGFSVDLSDDVLVIGAREDAEVGVHEGAAHVYRFDGTQWNWSQKLFASDASTDDWFGHSVAVHGDRILVGAPGYQIFEKTGAAYVFVDDGTNFTEEAKLLAEDPSIADFFGFSVALDEETIVVGAYGDGPTGTASVFQQRDQGWALVQTLVAEGATTHVGLGYAVAVDGPRIGATAPWLGYGQILVFRTDGANWFEETRLAPGQIDEWEHFGLSLTLHHATFAAGGPGSPFPIRPGVGFVYQGDGLDLTIEPDPVDVGEEVLFELRGGEPNQLLGIWLTKLDDSVFLQRVGLFRFDGDGVWSVQATIPPDLAGHTFTFLGLGFADCGAPTWSDPEDLTVH